MNSQQREFVLVHTQVLVMATFRIAHEATMHRMSVSRLSAEYPSARERQDQAWETYREARRALTAREDEQLLLLIIPVREQN